MGFRKGKKKGGDGKTREPKPNVFRGEYKEIVHENENMLAYYKAQGLMPESELEEMFTTFKKPLPTTFRITGSYDQASELLDTLEHKMLPNLQRLEVDGEVLELPSALPWYPNRLGWQVSQGRTVLRKDETYKKFHSFLVSESEVGNLSRQEAVSMVPPLLLKVNSSHKVLDMCAAPGSKTAQLMESLHSDVDSAQHDKLGLPQGFILANDASPKRCFTLIHQIKRLKSPNFLVTNHDAQLFPNLTIDNKLVKFDRILCDVPCSGDGTLRKNYMIWKDWTVGQGLTLHKLQLDILKRGLQMLKVGGRLVYSTCSINPIENEAVVAAALSQYQDKVQLVDCSQELNGLERRQGVTDWKVFIKNDTVLEKFEDFSPVDARKKWAVPTLFPPTDIKSLNIERCLRIYPHLQNTGGFFVAVFEKVQPFNHKDETEIDPQAYRHDEVEVKEGLPEPTETVAEEAKQEREPKENEEADEKSQLESPKVKRVKSELAGGRANNGSRMYEEPFVFLKPESPELENIKEHFQLADFPTHLFLVRSFTDHNNTIHLVSPSVQQLLKDNSHALLNLVNCGIKVFVRNSGQQKHTNKFRLQNEALTYLHPYLPHHLQVEVKASDLLLLLKEKNPLLNQFSVAVQDLIQQLDSNTTSILATFDPLKVDREDPNQPELQLTSRAFHKFYLPVWKANVSLNLLLSIQEKNSLKLRLFGP